MEAGLIQGIQDEIAIEVEKEREKYSLVLPASGDFSHDELWRALDADQDGDAWLYAQIQKDKFLYDHSSGFWYRWDEHHWIEDLTGQALAELDCVVECYSKEANNWSWMRLKATQAGKVEEANTASDKEKAFLKRVHYLQHLHYKKCILTLAATGDNSLGISGGEWDANPWLLPVKNGVVDLKTGHFRAGLPSDFMKVFAPASWAGIDAPAGMWGRFIQEIAGSEEKEKFLQRLFGYAILGESIEHILVILYGDRGRNGKGTLLEVLAYTLGPLAGPVQSELLLDQSRLRSSSSPASDILSLRGRRLVWASETGEGRRLDSGKIKWLTGNDTLCGRQPYGKREVYFRPSHTLFLLTNHKPRADANDHALFHRLVLIPFTLQFVDDPIDPYQRKRDPLLLDKLKAEAPGILAWLVRGCLAWQKEGLSPPKEIKAAICSYKENEDLLGHFLQEKCELDQGGQVQAGALYKAYRKWSEDNGHRPMSVTRFGELIKDRFDSHKLGCVYYQGINLLPEC